MTKEEAKSLVYEMYSIDIDNNLMESIEIFFEYDYIPLCSGKIAISKKGSDTILHEEENLKKCYQWVTKSFKS